MKAVVKKGREILFGDDEFIYAPKGKMILNLIDRWSYEGFSMRGNRMFIHTINGEIELRFTGEPPKVEFDHQEKDQLVFSVLKN
jgi:hypothetical protein